jgi:hypothetical protein
MVLLTCFASLSTSFASFPPPSIPKAIAGIEVRMRTERESRLELCCSKGEEDGDD